MKKVIVTMMGIMATIIMSGCTNPPGPTAPGGQSKQATFSGNEIEFMTGKFSLLQLGGTTINAKDGSTITFVPNPPMLSNQPKTF